MKPRLSRMMVVVFPSIQAVLVCVLVAFCLMASGQNSKDSKPDVSQHDNATDQRLTKLETQRDDEKEKTDRDSIKMDTLHQKQEELSSEIIELKGNINNILRILYIMSSMLATTVLETGVRLFKSKMKNVFLRTKESDES